MEASSSTAARERLRRARTLTVILAVLAPLALWVVVEQLIGYELRSPEFGDGEVADVGAVNVIVAAGVGSILAWTALALLERLTVHAPKIWLAATLAVFAVSLGGPLSGSGIEAVNRAVLASMHALVTGVLVAGLYGSALREARTASARAHSA